VREATSARVAHWMREQGYDARVIVGGLRAWERSGYQVETVPADDLVQLPKFN
jgi:rhodanese-related sulfurtransferase